MQNESLQVGFKSADKAPNPPFFSFYIIDPGLVTLSKFKTVATDFIPYKHKTGIDSIAYKGLHYTRY
jgi:hypothetical protein